MRGNTGGMRNKLSMLLLACVAMTACAVDDPVSGYASDYQTALERQQGTEDQEVIERGVERFRQTLGDFSRDDLAERVAELYAADVYFNDTFKTITSRGDIVEHLAATGEQVASSNVEVQQIIVKGQDAYLRWLMDFRFTAAGKTIDSRSIGMSHLRFNEDAEVILQQDFWDSTEGFFAHVPYVGYWVRRVRGDL